MKAPFPYTCGPKSVHRLDGERRSRSTVRPSVRCPYDCVVVRPTVTPAFVDELIERCRRAFDGDDGQRRAASTIIGDLVAIRDHLVAAEQGDLGEWIRDLPDEKIGDFLADMEVTARQADADADIGSFISALADWQTTAQALRNGW